VCTVVNLCVCVRACVRACVCDSVRYCVCTRVSDVLPHLGKHEFVGLGIRYDATMSLQRSVLIASIRKFITTSKVYLTTSKTRQFCAAHEVLTIVCRMCN